MESLCVSSTTLCLFMLVCVRMLLAQLLGDGLQTHDERERARGEKTLLSNHLQYNLMVRNKLINWIKCYQSEIDFALNTMDVVCVCAFNQMFDL